MTACPSLGNTLLHAALASAPLYPAQGIKNKKTRGTVQRAEAYAKGAAVSAARAELLLPSTAG